MPMLERTAGLPAFVDGTPGAAIAPGVVVCDSDAVVTHTRPGPFTASELDALLREHGVERVGIAGVATNASVESAVRQAVDLGYYVTVVADACAAGDAATHEASLSSLAVFAQITEPSPRRAVLRTPAESAFLTTRSVRGT
jgi:nicotinamidase-related amidase